MAIRKEVLHRRGALASPATRAPGAALDKTTREALDRVLAWVEANGSWHMARSEAGVASPAPGELNTIQSEPRRAMDLGLKGKVAMVAGASRGLGFAVAQALANEGALVSIASRDEAVDLRRRRASRRRSRCSPRPLDVKSADGIQRWTRATEDRFGGVDLLFANGGGPPAGAALSFDDAAWQEAVDLLLFSSLAHGPGGGALHDGSRRRSHPDVHVVVGQGANPEPGVVHGAACVGVGAGQDARARARRRPASASTRSSPAASTPTASASSTRSTARSRG